MQNIEALTGNSLKALEDLLQTFQNTSPALPDLLRVCLLNDYQGFVRLIHDVLDRSARYMTSNPQHYQGQREEALTNSLLQHFDALNIEANAETSIGGHCDIVIRHRPKGWLWLGESKKHTSYQHLNNGLNQLIDRYAAPDDGQDQGGLIAFIFTQKPANVIKQWREYVAARCDCLAVTDSTTRKALTFHSHHPETDQTGLDFHIKHIGIPLYYAPDDKQPLPAKAASTLPELPPPG